MFLESGQGKGWVSNLRFVNLHEWNREVFWPIFFQTLCSVKRTINCATRNAVAEALIRLTHLGAGAELAVQIRKPLFIHQNGG